VRGSLRQMALARLGTTQLALDANDHYFRAKLAAELERPLGARVVSILRLQGTASQSDGTARANRVQVLGVDESFWKFGLEPAAFQPPRPEEVVLNQALADQLRTRPGETILLRVEKPARLSREAPISPQDDFALALRVTVRAIAPDNQMGRFSLQANQVAPFNAFVSASWLADRLGIAGRANLMLAGPGAPASTQVANEVLRQNWQLADAQLELYRLPENGGFELRTSRVFLEPSIVAAAMKASPLARGILTYFVNDIRDGDRTTPYSMVAAMGVPVVPP